MNQWLTNVQIKIQIKVTPKQNIGMIENCCLTHL